jgi:hypothetical protein
MSFAAVRPRLRAVADHRGGGRRRSLRALAALLAVGLLAASRAEHTVALVNRWEK